MPEPPEARHKQEEEPGQPSGLGGAPECESGPSGDQELTEDVEMAVGEVLALTGQWAVARDLVNRGKGVDQAKEGRDQSEDVKRMNELIEKGD